MCAWRTVSGRAPDFLVREGPDTNAAGEMQKLSAMLGVKLSGICLAARGLLGRSSRDSAARSEIP
jgi:hypothetical protein